MGIVKDSEKQKSLLELLRREPGLDIFTIASKLEIEPWNAQHLADELRGKNKLNSGLMKREGTTIFERHYFCPNPV
mgnify:CR=1 FL=1